MRNLLIPAERGLWGAPFVIKKIAVCDNNRAEQQDLLAQVPALLSLSLE